VKSHRLFAAVYDPVTSLFEPRIEEHRRYLARGLDGRALELGAGTGAMLPYLSGTDASLYAVEPDPHMRKRAHRRAEQLDVEVEIRSDIAESLSYDDDSFDSVVSALVFCTVEDPDAALDEVARVLRPGGELRFLEHVGNDGLPRRLQEAANPLWRRCAGGCNLTRETIDRFDSHEEFETVEQDPVDGVPPVLPMVRGRLELV
jgi:ubiquinone/menaquinone biosynthesis C-methylase UbiE